MSDVEMDSDFPLDLALASANIAANDDGKVAINEESTTKEPEPEEDAPISILIDEEPKVDELITADADEQENDI